MINYNHKLNTRRFESLDGLRGLAALVVYLSYTRNYSIEVNKMSIKNIILAGMRRLRTRIKVFGKSRFLAYGHGLHEIGRASCRERVYSSV